MSQPATSERPRPGSLAARLATRSDDGSADGTVLTFAGQGWTWWESLDELLAHRDDLTDTVRRWTDTVHSLQRLPGLRDRGRSVDLDPLRWASAPGRRPDAGRLSGPSSSFVGCLFTQLLTWRSLWTDGLADAVASGAVRGAAGHSAGILAAAAVAEQPDGLADDDRVAEWLHLALLLGDELAAHPASATPAALTQAAAGDPAAKVPMVAVSGIRLDRLADRLADVAPDVRIALRHGPFRCVVAGPAASVDRARARLDGGTWEPLPVGFPAHHPMLADAAERLVERIDAVGLTVDAGRFAFPVLSLADAQPYSGGCADALLGDIMSRPGSWDRTVRTLVAQPRNGAGGEIRWVLDVGPGDGVARLAAAALRGTSARVVPVGTATGRRQLLTPGAIPASGRRYDDLLPVVVELPDGSRRLENRFTRSTGRSPMVLPGMTPTTADAPIVAAAANGGFLAELAGGGQVSERILTLRLEELSQLLEPGQEVVFNALLLDPYLWGLHLGRDRLVQAARRAGAPICGVTVSAGIPELADAVALLDELAELGMWCNAFKPGTVEQIRRVIAIASAAPRHTVFVHVEGGTAGGHHSWEDLEDLLLQTYHDLRAEPNIVLCVGGGIGTAERSGELLRGIWAERHGSLPLPVDAVLLGTVAMACAEATATGPVKAALRAAGGTDGFVRAGQVRGGVTSGRSGLNADIHFLDNDASRCAAILDQVAGDADAVADRRDEIVEALSRTAKPYIGEIAEMTCLRLLGRFAELTALGRHGRYDDGIWLDPSHRDRFVALLQRAEGRLDPCEQGRITTSFPQGADVDDPQRAIAQLAERYPEAADTQVHPADVAHFLEVCRRPGKPVPFVPVIDADVRRWYQSDSLWQAQHPAFDARQVLVIPGPQAVSGIDRADQPVAELLGDLEAAVVASLLADGQHPRPVDRLRRTGPTEPFGGPVAVIGESASVVRGGRIVTNPMLALAPPADWHCSADHDGRLVRSELEVPAVGGGTERVTVSVDGECALATLEIPALVTGVDGNGNGPTDTIRLAFHHVHRNGVEVVEVDDAVWNRALSDLLTDTLLDGSTRPTPLGTTCSVNVDVDRGRMLAHAASVGAGAGTVLPDAWLGLAWPAVFAVLGAPELLPGLLDLVHLEHEVRADGPPPTGPVQVAALVTGLSPFGGGCRVDTEATLTASDGTRASLHSAVLLRGHVVPDTPAARSVIRRGESPNGGGGGSSADGVAIRPVRTVATASVTAPDSMDAFAAITGDRNPIHRSVLAARLAGFAAPVVHGAWTSAVAQRVLCGPGDPDGIRPERIRSWAARFLAPVELADELTVTVVRTGVRSGAQVMEVDVVAERPEGPVVVLSARAEVAPPRTAYLFPGQGIQRPGMGMDGYERSAAARAVWDRADAHTRDRLGFSILEVVRDNPTTLATPQETYRHPAGVLHLTQFTQVAMATLASAQVAEMREAGVFDEYAVTAGHSVGEYNALAAVAGVLPLEAVVELVFRRGLAMHHLVPRDAAGNSGYRLGVVRPHEVGLAHAALEELVAAVRDRSGGVLEIVNFNLRGKQYAVAGTLDTLDALEAELRRRSTPGRKPAFLMVPGIDVPFHSSVLSDGVAEFRSHLDAGLPTRIDPDLLVGRYIPNLVPRAFTLERAFVEEVRDTTGSGPLDDVLDDWEAWTADPQVLARELLIELLAWQFASPVRWIETQDLLFTPAVDGGLGVERVVEVGLGTQPTVANLARGTVALADHHGPLPEILNVEAERVVVFAEDEDPRPEPTLVDEGDDPPSDGAAEPAPDAPPPVALGAVSDLPASVGEGLSLLLAVQLKVRPDQLLPGESIDDLVDGVSSRRNQLLMDMGAEFNVAGVDGAQELALADLDQELRVRAPRYRAPGPVLRDAVDAALTNTLGPLGARRRDVGARIREHWGLGEGWVDRVAMTLAADTRTGDSTRGGPLGRLVPLPGDAVAVIDAAVALAAGDADVVVTAPAADATSTVDAAAVEALHERIAGPDGLLARTARDLLARTGGGAGAPDPAVDDDTRGSLERLRILDDEHGRDRAEAVRPQFDGRRHVAFTSWWATARHDVVRLHHDGLGGRLTAEDLEVEARRLARHSVDPAVAATARWFAARAAERGDAAARTRFERIVAGAAGAGPSERSGEVVLVTGASPGGIAHEMVRQLLSEGAVVVCTTTTDTPERLDGYRELYRNAAAPGAELHVVPANLASFQDVDALVGWLHEQPLPPSVVVPFAAGGVTGELPDAGPTAEVAMRTLLFGVERLVGGLVEGMDRHGTGGATMHVVLPGSPNHGTFGGDGAYGEAKAALRAMAAKWRSEHQRWGRHVTMVLANIGWVRGTGLMEANDAVAGLLEERLGIRTFSAAEMAGELIRACGTEVRELARAAPVELDLDGGLAGVDVAAAVVELRGEIMANRPVTDGDAASTEVTVPALLSPPRAVPVPDPAPVTPSRPLEEMVVVVGAAEVGPWGGSVTRFDLELDGSLDPSSVLELAWWCGLVRWEASGNGAGWVDVDSGDPVPEGDVVERYGRDVSDRCGVRTFDVDGPLDPGGHDLLVEVFLDEDLTLEVGSEAEARAMAAVDPDQVTVRRTSDGRWTVTRRAGTGIRVPRRAGLSRRVGGQIPAGFDPTAWGVPAEMAASVDRVSLWNLVATVEAFIDAGMEPEELLARVHPARVGNTQGSGMGGMGSLRGLYVDALLGRDWASDLLQEGLGNVIAAYVVQGYVGGYGPMVQPVAACATAAVSIEAGVDAIRLGKADVVVAGGWDDLGLEGVLGFGAMSATASTDAMEAAGLVPHQFSRANDRRRAGFVEAQGGGTLLLARASVAAAMALPVRGVVVYAASASDGIHTSIPAPGLGALTCALGGVDSPLGRALAAHGLTADDVAVISKHDTSTAANDPNESDLHERIAAALGRTPGNPLLTVSQKTVTGHAKGGAAAWQAIGLLQVLESGQVPGNRNLQSLDETHRDHHTMVYGHRAVVAGEVLRAGLLTSLGFGHVSAVVCLAHPSVFLAALDAGVSADDADRYRRSAVRRRLEGRRRALDARHGGPVLYRKRTDRRLDGSDGSPERRDAEVALLTDPRVRLGSDGRYAVPSDGTPSWP